MSVDPSSPAELHRALSELGLDRSSRRPHADLRRRVLELFAGAAEAGVIMDMVGEQDWNSAPVLSETELAQMPEHLLLVWCHDTDGCAGYALPLGGEHQQLIDDARAVAGLRFAGAPDCGPAELGAAVRLIAAMNPWPAARVFDDWRPELDRCADRGAVQIDSADDLAPFVGALQEHYLRSPGAFGHRIVGVASVNRAT